MTIDLLIRFQNAIALRQDDRGAAMAEYGMLLALISLAAIGILALFGGELVDVFTEAEGSIARRDRVPAPD